MKKVVSIRNKKSLPTVFMFPVRSREELERHSKKASS